MYGFFRIIIQNWTMNNWKVIAICSIIYVLEHFWIKISAIDSQLLQIHFRKKDQKNTYIPLRISNRTVKYSVYFNWNIYDFRNLMWNGLCYRQLIGYFQFYLIRYKRNTFHLIWMHFSQFFFLSMYGKMFTGKYINLRQQHLFLYTLDAILNLDDNLQYSRDGIVDDRFFNTHKHCNEHFNCIYVTIFK